MKERLVPVPDASSYVMHLASVIISWNAQGHEKEYLINLPGLVGTIGDEVIPQPIADDLQKRLGEDWTLSNRGQRLEVYGMGNRDDEFVVGAVMTYFDELAALPAK